VSVFPQSLRARLTLWYTVVLSLPLGAFAVVSYLSFASALRGRTDAFLVDALTAFANELVAERRQIPGLDEAIRTTVAEVRFRDLDILILDRDGRLQWDLPWSRPRSVRTATASIRGSRDPRQLGNRG
jgi:hypothetical protein